MDKQINRFDRFLWVFLLINPFLDVITGVYINLREHVTGVAFKTLAVPVTPGLVVRTAMLLVFAAYLLSRRSRTGLLTLAGVAAAWALSVASEYFVFGSLALFSDMQYIARFAFNLAALLAYGVSLRGREDANALLERAARVTLLVFSLTILLSVLFGVGYSTYTDRFGFRGSRGFFYAGNDVSAAMLLLLPLAFSSWLELPREASAGRKLLYVLTPAFTCAALCLLGTKTAFLAVAVSAAFFLIYTLAAPGRRTRFPRTVLVLAAAAAVLALLSLGSATSVPELIAKSFTMTGNIAQQENVGTALLSGRPARVLEALRLWRSGGVFAWLFGTGRGLHGAILEMDVFELLVYYGVVGGTALAWYWLRELWRFVLAFFRRLRGSLPAASCLLALVLGCAYLFLAGHVLFSVTSGFYLAMLLLYGEALARQDAA